MKSIILNNGVEMPQIGLGTFLIPKEDLSRTIAEAYELGYRSFDTAWRYYNEKDLAKAFKENGIKREDIFITTKVNRDALYFGKYDPTSRFNIKNFKSIRNVLMESFNNLKCDYIDLFLVHWPYPLELSMRMYEELSTLYRQGRIRAIGTCSSLPPIFNAFKEVSDIAPAVNQFEISPLNTQKELIRFCREQGCAVTAMSTFSHFRTNNPRKEIFENELLQGIAEKHHKSVAQIVLRWLVQQDIIIIPKTWFHEHLVENISIEDFSLSNNEMELIDSLDQGKFLNYNPYKWYSTIPAKYKQSFNNRG